MVLMVDGVVGDETVVVIVAAVVPPSVLLRQLVLLRCPPKAHVHPKC